LYVDLGIADQAPDDVMHSFCDPELPDVGRFGVELLRQVTSGRSKQGGGALKNSASVTSVCFFKTLGEAGAGLGLSKQPGISGRYQGEATVAPALNL
jgi:hypothetical protein